MFHFHTKQENFIMSDAEFQKAFPTKEVGIFNPKAIYNQTIDQLQQVQTQHSIRFKANQTTASTYGNKNEADSLYAVWQHTPLSEVFAQWVVEFPEATYLKPATMMQDAYLDMAKNTGRGNNNGYQHNLYAIGTGQTLSAITDRIRS